MHTKICLKNIAKFASLAVAALTLNTASADVILELDLSTPNQITLRAVTPGLASTTATVDWWNGWVLAGTYAPNDPNLNGGYSVAGSSTFGVDGYLAADQPAIGRVGFRFSPQELYIYDATTTSTNDNQLVTAGQQVFTGEVTFIPQSSFYDDLLQSASGGDVNASVNDSTVIGQWRLVTSSSSSSVPDSSSTLALLSLSLLGLFAVKRNQLSKTGSVSFSKA